MVTFDVVAALVAGLAGTVAMTVMMQASGAMGLTKMPSMPLIQGTMVTGDEEKARRLGTVTHVIYGLVVALVYGLLA